MEGKRYSLMVGARSDAEIFATLETASSKQGYIVDALESYIDGSSRPVDAFDASTEEKYRQLVEYVMRNYPQEYAENRERIYTFALSDSVSSEIFNRLESQRNKTAYIKMVLLTNMGFMDSGGNRFVVRGLNVDNDGNIITRTRTERRREQLAVSNERLKNSRKTATVSLTMDEYRKVETYLEKTGQQFSGFAAKVIMEAVERCAKVE